jgi:hypothetical protein
MSTTFILIYIIAIVSIVLIIAGFTSLIYGLIAKNKKLTIRGSIMTFLAILILVTGVFYGARKVFHFAIYQYQYYEKNHQNRHSKCDNMCDSTMMKCCKGDMKDSTCAGMNMKCCKMKKECEKDKSGKCDMDKNKKCDNKCPEHKK